MQIKLPAEFSANIYLFKANNRNTRQRCELYPKLTITPGWRQWCRSGVSIVHFEHVFACWWNIFIIPFEQVTITLGFISLIFLRLLFRSSVCVVKLLSGTFNETSPRSVNLLNRDFCLRFSFSSVEIVGVGSIWNKLKLCQINKSFTN